ncbi:MAG TPA: hypothetical protein VM938_06815 [Acidimicrobiales bacterium]|nr:hypothetical protein [Acidimicrobiales bacterium]
MPATGNVQGMVAQRQALSRWLRDLPADGWNDTVRAVVERVCTRYLRALDRDDTVSVPDDRAAAADMLDRVGQGTEMTFADRADDRWELSRDEFRAEGGTTEMNIDDVIASLHIAAVELGRLTGRPVAIPPEAREAAVAAVVWRASDKVEAPVRIVLDTGTDYMVGPGTPAGVLETDSEAVLEVAGGVSEPSELAAAGRWRFEGPDDAREAFERTFRIDYGGD